MSATFEIAPADISGARIAGIAAQPYTGSPAEPALSVALGEGEGAVELVAGRDYEASYSANVDAGTATATATGKGNYAGSVSATFEIAPVDISSAVVAPVPPQLYKGAPVESTLAVSDAFGNVTAVAALAHNARISPIKILIRNLLAL